MNWNNWIRRSHRWLSVAFTLAILVNGVAVTRGKYFPALGLVAVFPLALSFLTGAYLFVLPYATRWRRGRHAA